MLQTGPHGTPAASKVWIQCAAVCRESAPCSSGMSSARCETRAAFVAYRSAEGVVVIDLVTGMSVITELEPGVTAIYSDAHLLRSGASTFAVNTDTLEVSRVADNSSVVVSDTLDGHTYLVDSGSLSGQPAIGCRPRAIHMFQEDSALASRLARVLGRKTHISGLRPVLHARIEVRDISMPEICALRSEC